MKIPAEIADLVRVARVALRDKFIQADVGISGGNIGIAETGTVVLVTNEGNGRLVTTLPPVHIAIMGVEKVVPTQDDANEILKILSKNATGQKMTSYVSFMTGPSRSGDIELELAIGVHGPVEMHIVLLDNGRTVALADPELRDALRCIKCGACANVCPSYQVVGGHAFGHIYTGPIGLVLTAVHHGLEAAGPPQSLCLSCNACETVCPVGIPIPQQIIDVRQRYVAQKGLPTTKRIAIDSLRSPRRLGLTTGMGRLVQGMFAEGRFVRRFPFAKRLTSWRSLPVLAKQSSHDRLRRILSDGHANKQTGDGGSDGVSSGTSRTARSNGDAPGQMGRAATNGHAVERAFPDVPGIAGSRAERLRIAYFPGCITDQVYPEMAEAAVKVLEACGCSVTFPADWSCCGLPASNAGDRATALETARGAIVALERVPADYLVSTSASCVVMMTQDYPHLFADNPEWSPRAKALAARVVDLTSFLDRIAQLPAGALVDGPARTVTYHDACQSANCLGLRPEARRLIQEVMGLPLVEMAESSRCCGFGGSFSFDYPEVSRRILARKLGHVAATGADTVVADNPGCLLQLRGGLDADRSSVAAMHLVELMAERLSYRS